MKKIFRYCFVVAVASCLLLTQLLLAEEGINGNLASINWLEKNLKNPEVLILDASSPPQYMAKHIPGAVGTDLYGFIMGEPSAAELSRIYQSWGISPGKKLVMYDEGGDVMATRLFFALYYNGYPAKNMLVLDGGLAKWQEKGLPVTKDAPSTTKGSFTITKFEEDVRARLPEVLNASGDTVNNALVEALGPDWHFGETAPFSKGGHIPNGILLPSKDFFNADKTFKSAEEIKTMLAYYDIRPEQKIQSYCGGGVSASVPWFAIKFLANYPEVSLYKESELGWLTDERGLPYWTYDAPNMMRDSSGLRFWTDARPRMVGIGHVSIVDVRTADAYKQGHVPFALNIPAEEFKSNLTDPVKLAKILGPAGVNASDEAVVFSGGGLTKDSALAFVMLEKLGQKKVSIFTDSMEQWSKLGFDVKKDPTVVGAKKGPYDLSIPPTNYSETPRKGVVVADATGMKGLYPKVFLASGKDLPAKAQDGKVVHVPYTDLLNADGTPKAAKDIWTILSKAGVPRYGELVCFSDEPGEAAVNYFILKLMGYPDVKVLAG